MQQSVKECSELALLFTTASFAAASLAYIILASYKKLGMLAAFELTALYKCNICSAYLIYARWRARKFGIQFVVHVTSFTFFAVAMCFDDCI
jgi:hypothetical protein